MTIPVRTGLAAPPVSSADQDLFGGALWTAVAVRSGRKWWRRSTAPVPLVDQCESPGDDTGCPKTRTGGSPRNDAMRCAPARRNPAPSAQTNAVGQTRPASDRAEFTTKTLSAQADTGTVRCA